MKAALFQAVAASGLLGVVQATTCQREKLIIEYQPAVVVCSGLPKLTTICNTRTECMSEQTMGVGSTSLSMGAMTTKQAMDATSSTMGAASYATSSSMSFQTGTMGTASSSSRGMGSTTKNMGSSTNMYNAQTSSSTSLQTGTMGTASSSSRGMGSATTNMGSSTSISTTQTKSMGTGTTSVSTSKMTDTSRSMSSSSATSTGSTTSLSKSTNLSSSTASSSSASTTSTSLCTPIPGFNYSIFANPFPRSRDRSGNNTYDNFNPSAFATLTPIATGASFRGSPSFVKRTGVGQTVYSSNNIDLNEKAINGQAYMFSRDQQTVTICSCVLDINFMYTGTTAIRGFNAQNPTCFARGGFEGTPSLLRKCGTVNVAAGSFTPLRWVYGSSFLASLNVKPDFGNDLSTCGGTPPSGKGALLDFHLNGTVSTPELFSTVCDGKAPAFPRNF